MDLTLLSLALVVSAADQAARFNCPAAERRAAEFTRSLKAGLDPTRRYEIGVHLGGFLDAVQANQTACASERILPLLIELVEDPDVEVSYEGSQAIRVLGPDAIAALPALRRALPRAKAAVQADYDRRKAAGDPAWGVTGFNEEMAIELAIGELEYARVYPPRWENGLCTRLERRGTLLEREAGSPEELYLRVSLSHVDSANCTTDMLRQVPTWKFSSEALSAEANELPSQLFESWTQLSRFLKSGVDANDVCPASSSNQVSAGLRLSDMRLNRIDASVAQKRYTVSFEYVDPKRDVSEYVHFSFAAGRDIRVAELGDVDCAQSSIAWYR